MQVSPERDLMRGGLTKDESSGPSPSGCCTVEGGGMLKLYGGALGQSYP